MSNNQNGASNGMGASSGPHVQGRRYSRPFMLQEALPYSPFTSISPFLSSKFIITAQTVSSPLLISFVPQVFYLVHRSPSRNRALPTQFPASFSMR